MSIASPIARITFIGSLLLGLLFGSLPVRAQSGLVGWWKFDEATGTVAVDSSTFGNTGTLVNSPTRAAGEIGPGALTFNGTNNYVNVPNASGSLDNLASTRMTVTAWIKATGTGGGGGGRIIEKGGWFFSMASAAGSPVVRFTCQDSAGFRNSTTIPLNTWVHVAATWDGAGPGSGMHLFINGAAADDSSPTAGNGTPPDSSDIGPASIGNRASDAARGFAGSIDELRVYNRVLSAAEIHALADTTAPSTPSSLSATAVTATQINLSWSAASDNVGVTAYLVERCQGSACSNFTQIAAPATTTYGDSGLSASTSYTYRVRAIDAAGNASSYSIAASTTTLSASDTTPPSSPGALSANGVSSTQISLSWTASTDNVGVTGYRVERCQGSTCTFTEIARPTSTSYTDTGLGAATSYSYRVRANDAAGNLSSYSPTASATTAATGSGPVGWWKFDEGSGTTTADSSAFGNTGTLVNSPTWIAGHLGSGALTFNASNNYVNLPNTSGSLDNLSNTRMTVAAWIKATGLGGGNGGRIVEKDGWFFAMASAGGSPVVRLTCSVSAGFRNSTTIPLNTWVHIAATWDGSGPGSGIHLFINGVSAEDPNPNVGNGTAPNGTDVGPASIGNRASDLARGFAGSIDDVRIYSRILTAAEIQALVDTTAPSAPTGVTAAGSSGSQINLTWTASTDNVGVSSYFVERCQGSSCSSFIPAGTTTTGSFTDSGLAPATTYTYRIRATDVNGNLSGYSSTITAATQSATLVAQPTSAAYTYDALGRLTNTQYNNGAAFGYTLDPAGNRTNLALTGVPDTIPPKQPGALTAVATGATTATASWGASTDNVGVAGYDYRLNGGTWTELGNVLTVSLTGLTGSTTYTIDLRARDAAGLFSPLTSGSVTTLEGTPPSQPGALAFSNLLTSSATATWGASSDNVGVIGYDYSVNGGSWISLGNVLTVNLTGLISSTSYTFDVRARDAAANTSQLRTGTFTTPSSNDTTPPTTPGAPTFSAITATSATATWTASSDNVGVIGYDYRLNGGAWISLGNVLTVGLTGLSAGATYTFDVRARDARPNFSNLSTGSFQTPETVPPSQPGTVTVSSITASSAVVGWGAATDNTAVAGYDYRLNGGTWISLGNVLSVALTGLSNGVNYTVDVRARDVWSNAGNPVSATFATIDTVAPGQPGVITITSVTAVSATASWGAATDNRAVTGYEYRVYVTTQAPPATWTTVPGGAVTSVGLSSLIGGLPYTIEIRAFDAAGNRGVSRTVPFGTTNPITTVFTNGVSFTQSTGGTFNIHAEYDFGPSGFSGSCDAPCSASGGGQWLSPAVGMGNYEVMATNGCPFSQGTFNTWRSADTLVGWAVDLHDNGTQDLTANCSMTVSIRAKLNPGTVLGTASINFSIFTGP